MDADLRRCYLRDGQVLTVYDNRFAAEHGANAWQEDACWLTGLYTSALSFAFAVTADPEIREDAREAWGALHQMSVTTPLRGEVVRHFARSLPGVQLAPATDNTRKHWHRDAERELYWIGDTSVDQRSGWFAGVSVYYDLAADGGGDPDPERRVDSTPPCPEAIRGGLEHRFSGVAYLLAYRMGRYHGLLSGAGARD